MFPYIAQNITNLQISNIISSMIYLHNTAIHFIKPCKAVSEITFLFDVVSIGIAFDPMTYDLLST